MEGCDRSNISQVVILIAFLLSFLLTKISVFCCIIFQFFFLNFFYIKSEFGNEEVRLGQINVRNSREQSKQRFRRSNQQRHRHQIVNSSQRA
ncbi:hypothetical protein D8674_039837 [Pyrus ussuriensis x Pyrus communis]|uniref:Uncharacterized protein n=1 Tax=Pyrus ussuriensis x Pyrus communis TaxID=2448454 RepID=A0A5N5I4K5_9ROSA|nr:hypothetical protein D8674_039837 [Pyrus ussuriensis x Pyrus communis]